MMRVIVPIVVLAVLAAGEVQVFEESSPVESGSTSYIDALIQEQGPGTTSYIDELVQSESARKFHALTRSHLTYWGIPGQTKVKPPGYTYEDAYRGYNKGYITTYHLGPSRRRIGAGFGRRRRTKGRKWGFPPNKSRKMINNDMDHPSMLRKGKKVFQNINKRPLPAWMRGGKGKRSAKPDGTGDDDRVIEKIKSVHKHKKGKRTRMPPKVNIDRGLAGESFKKGRKSAKKPSKKGKKMAPKAPMTDPNWVKYCEVDVKGHKLNHLRGRCRGYKRFCKLYWQYKMPKETRKHCALMVKFHKKLVGTPPKRGAGLREKAQKKKIAKARKEKASKETTSKEKSKKESAVKEKKS